MSESTPYPSSYPAQATRLIETLEAVDQAAAQGQPADRWLNHLFRSQRSLGSQTRRLISNTVFSFFRWRGWVFDEQAPDYPTALIQAHTLDHAAPHPLITWMAKERGLVLSDTLATLSLAEKGEALGRAPTDLIPAWSRERLIRDLAEDEATAHQLLNSFQMRPPTWLRIEQRVSDDVLAPLESHGYTFQRHHSRPRAVSTPDAISRAHLEAKPRRPLEIQDLASQCVSWIAAPRSGQVWWDCCAGSGGKSLHLIDLMRYRGRVFASERDQNTARALHDRIKRHPEAAKQISSRCVDATTVSWPKPFDGVLVDAPCSGMGTWSRSPDARWRMTSKRVDTLAQRQIELLQHASKWIRPGGVLVYAVCTLTETETHAVCDQFDATHQAFTRETFKHPLTGAACDGRVLIEPWSGPSGAMFIAKWHYKGS